MPPEKLRRISDGGVETFNPDDTFKYVEVWTLLNSRGFDVSPFSIKAEGTLSLSMEVDGVDARFIPAIIEAVHTIHGGRYSLD